MIALEVIKFPETVIEIVVTLVLALICRVALRRVIDRAVARATQRQGEHGLLAMGRSSSVVATTGGVNTSRSTQRTKTLGSILKSMTDVVLIVVVVLMVLNSLNINIGPALASAGIVGVAVGFGAQSLFKDLFSGVFMLAEDQYGVGDIIEVNKLKGTVRSVGFRVTELQDFNGEVWYVRNGEINTVGNVSQGFTSSIVTIPVSVDESPKLVIRLLSRMLKKMDSEPDWHNKMLEEPKMLGLSDLDASTASYQISIKCPANAQWEVEREIRSRSLSTLSQAGVRMPVTTVATVPAHTADETVAMHASTRRHRLGQLAQQRLAQRNSPAAGGEGGSSNEAHDEGGAKGPAQTDTERPDASHEVIRHPSETRQPALPDPTNSSADSPDETAQPESDTGTVPADDAEPTVKAADSGQLRRARAWLDHGADRSVRWVSQGTAAPSEVHDMTADQTMLMNADEVLGKPSDRSDHPGAQTNTPNTPPAGKPTGDEAGQTRSLNAIDTGPQPGTTRPRTGRDSATGDDPEQENRPSPPPAKGSQGPSSDSEADKTRRLFGRRDRKRK